MQIYQEALKNLVVKPTISVGNHDKMKHRKAQFYNEEGEVHYTFSELFYTRASWIN